MFFRFITMTSILFSCSIANADHPCDAVLKWGSMKELKIHNTVVQHYLLDQYGSSSGKSKSNVLGVDLDLPEIGKLSLDSEQKKKIYQEMNANRIKYDFEEVQTYLKREGQQTEAIEAWKDCMSNQQLAIYTKEVSADRTRLHIRYGKAGDEPLQSVQLDVSSNAKLLGKIGDTLLGETEFIVKRTSTGPIDIAFTYKKSKAGTLTNRMLVIPPVLAPVVAEAHSTNFGRGSGQKIPLIEFAKYESDRPGRLIISYSSRAGNLQGPFTAVSADVDAMVVDYQGKTTIRDVIQMKSSTGKHDLVSSIVVLPGDQVTVSGFVGLDATDADRATIAAILTNQPLSKHSRLSSTSGLSGNNG